MTAAALRRGALLPILRRLCPRCREGAEFSGPFRMNENCPSCGLVFTREAGYFLGAMYFSYMLGVAAVSPLVVCGVVLGWPPWTIGVASTAVLAVLSPWLFQFSRVLWLWSDQRIDPR